MINVFQLADNDQAIFYLGQLFGNVGVVLAGTGPALLGTIFKVFNTALLAVGALIVTYTTVVGVLATAQEGEFLGKKWGGGGGALWIPIRTVAGIAALFPTKAGYCAIQVIIMWCIVQGIGAADMVWKAAVVYLGKGGTLNPGTPGSSDLAGTAPSVVRQLFNFAACQQAYIKFSTGNANATASAQFNPDTGCPAPLSGTCYRFIFGTPDWPNCGTIAWQKQMPPSPMEESQTNLMQAMVPVIESLANSFVNSVISDSNCWEECKTPPDCPYFKKYGNPKWSDSACLVNKPGTAWSKLREYAGSNFMIDIPRLIYGYATNYSIQSAMANQQQVEGTSITQVGESSQGWGAFKTNPQAAFQKAQANGWITAGAYYYYFAQQNNGQQGDITGFLNGINNKTPVQEDELKKVDLGAYNIYQEADQVASNANQGASAAANAGGAGGVNAGPPGSSGSADIGPSGNAIAQTGAQMVNTWAQNLTGSAGNPLVSLQQFGHSLLVGAEVLFWLMIPLAIIAGLASTDVEVFGTTVNYAAGLVRTVWNFFQMPLIFLMTYMLTIGATLGVYIPLLPYTYFTFGAIGWFLAVIDAMVAAPIVALGILSPGGQHEILGKAEPAAMILLNVCLRPTLMVIGMMAGMLLSYIVIRFINVGFVSVVQSIATNTSEPGKSGMGMFEGFIFIMAYASLVMTALTKCFSLIYLLPDQILRWVHGQTEAFGERAATEAGGGMKELAGAGGAVAGKIGAGVPTAAYGTTEGGLDAATEYATEGGEVAVGPPAT